LEKIPFSQEFFQGLYGGLYRTLKSLERFIEKVFCLPMRTLFAKLTKWVKLRINRFMGEKKLSSWYRLQRLKVLKPSAYMKLKKRGKKRKREKRHPCVYAKLQEKRF